MNTLKLALCWRYLQLRKGSKSFKKKMEHLIFWLSYIFLHYSSDNYVMAAFFHQKNNNFVDKCFTRCVVVLIYLRFLKLVPKIIFKIIIPATTNGSLLTRYLRFTGNIEFWFGGRSHDNIKQYNSVISQFRFFA